MTPRPRLLDRVRERLRLNEYSIRTEQSASAIVFLYKEVLGRALEWRYNVECTKCPARTPVVESIPLGRDARAIHWRDDSAMPDYRRAHVPGGT
jgi:hypothetical protein